MTAAQKSPPDRPFVEVPEYVEQCVRPEWGGGHEGDLLLVLEANRRFLIETQDPRQAAALTLAWAMFSTRGGS